MSTHIDADPAIDALYAAWQDAFRDKDVELILELLTPDYLLWAPAAPPLDRNTLRPRLEAALAAYDIVPQYECEERIIAGDFAFERGWDIQNVKGVGGGDTISQRQRVFLLLRRGADGIWRFARGMSHAGPTA